MVDATTTAIPYASDASKTFAALIQLYANNAGETTPAAYWKLGNTLDTLLDYLFNVDPTDAGTVVRAVDAQYGPALAAISGGYDGAWFDDFGWWSVATQRALDAPLFKRNAVFQGIHENCWSRYTANAPYVWDRRPPSTFDAYGPVVAGGVWNTYWQGTDPKWHGPKSGNPGSGNLDGIQNTVTNALYFRSAYQQRATNPDANKAAAAEWNFLRTWFDEPSQPLWWSTDANAGLVRERVGMVLNTQLSPPRQAPAPGWQSDWAWAGDQGLMLGNISDYSFTQAPGFRGWFLDRMTWLIAGVCANMTQRQAGEGKGQLLSFTTTGSVPNNDDADYQTGKGVFWRNALHVWQTNADARPIFLKPAFQDMLRASVDMAIKYPDTSFDGLTNDLAVLLAAGFMLGTPA